MNRGADVSQVLVSVCVPAYQAEPYIAATIESVLAQTHQRWELTILENNSSDRTGEIARSYNDPRITVHSNPTTLDLVDNWNAVVARSSGRYVKLLCADDVLYPTCLAEEAAAFAADETLAVVAGRRDFIDANGEVVLRGRGLADMVDRLTSIEAVQAIVRSGINPIGCPSAMMFTRDAFDLVGGFDDRWLYTVDLELAVRMLEHGNFHGLERSLSAYRISPSSASARLRNAGAQHREVLHHIAAEPHWAIGRSELNRGLLLTLVESVKRRLLFTTVNSRNPVVRRLPRFVLARGPKTDGPEGASCKVPA